MSEPRPPAAQFEPSTLYEALRRRVQGGLERALGRLGRRLGGYALTGLDLVHLYRGAVSDERVPIRVRGELIAAALYVVTPIDLVPEALFGPLGLVDDALVLSRLFDTLLNRLPEPVLKTHWPGDPELLARLQRLAAGGKKAFALGLGFGVRRLGRQAAAQASAATGTAAARWVRRARRLWDRTR